MTFTSDNAKGVAVKLVELLIQAGAYKNLGGDNTTEQVLKDVAMLTEGLTDPAYK